LGSCGVGHLEATNTVAGYDGASADIFNPGATNNTCNCNINGADCGFMGLCLGPSTDWRGNLFAQGDICIAAGASNASRDTITGIIHAGNDISIQNFNDVQGQVIALDDVGIDPNVEVNFDESNTAYSADAVTAAGAAGSAAWFEGAW